MTHTLALEAFHPFTHTKSLISHEGSNPNAHDECHDDDVVADDGRALHASSFSWT